MEDTLGPDLFVVELDRFQGPLDLLLHLIRKQDIDIFDIPIARITQQFLDVVNELERLELERAGEFLEMAATLVRIKAQMLFPRREEDELDDPRADLVRRLLEYEHFREIARTLEVAQRDRALFHSRGHYEPRPRPVAAEAILETEWSEVWRALGGLLERLTAPDPGYRVQGPIVRLDDKIDYVLGLLRERTRLEFTSLVAPWGSRMHAVISLLACLELAKRRSLRLRQASPFAPLWVYRSGGDAS